MARGFLSQNPTQPDTPALIVCPNLARTWPKPDPPHTCIVFLKGEFACCKFTFSQFHLPQPGYRREYITQRCQVCVCPSPHMNSDDSQQTIYNLQPARNVFYEMCFIKKEARGPDQTRLIWEPNWRVLSGLLGWPASLKTLLIRLKYLSAATASSSYQLPLWYVAPLLPPSFVPPMIT